MSPKPVRELPPFDPAEFRCGTIALVGRPNVGKSTLLNVLIGEKLSIVSDKPQTTRHRIRGIRTDREAQFIFVDTPGYQTRHKSALNRLMNRGVRQALDEVDVAVFAVECGRLGEEDKAVLALLPDNIPVVAVVNKIDRQTPEQILPFLKTLSEMRNFAAIVPVSAARKRGLGELLKTLRGFLPLQPAIYGEDEMTDRSERFLAAERIREKLFRLLGQELPYGTSVVIEKFEQEGRLRRIHAAIIVDRDSHKPIVVGAKGESLKRIASSARVELEALFDGKVYLEVWVKVRGGWADNAAGLASLGYDG